MSSKNSPEHVRAAFVEVWSAFIGCYPEGWLREEPGLVAFVSGVDLPTTNGVFVTDDAVDPARVIALLDEVASSGKPYALQGRAAPIEEVVRRTGERFVAEAAVPLMVLDGGVGPLTFKGLSVRDVREHDRDPFIRAGAESYGMPAELFGQMFTPAVFALAGLRTYCGEVEGEVVATACGVTVGDVVGIFAIGTLPGHRGRGFGAAVTAVAVEDGFRDGATFAVLQASPLGLPVYERMGFETVDLWAVCVCAP